MRTLLVAMLLGTAPAREQEKDPRAHTRVVIKLLSGAVELFTLDHGRRPATLLELVERPKDVEEKRWPPGGYLKKPLRDGWGREFIYRVPGTSGRPYDLGSLGSDGAEGGTGDAEDIWTPEARGKRP